MTPQGFDEFLGLIQDDITKTNINMRDFIPANLKLAATVRFLATGDSYTNLQYQFRVHVSTSSKFISEVCDAIYRKFKGAYLRVSTFIFYNLQKN